MLRKITIYGRLMMNPGRAEKLGVSPYSRVKNVVYANSGQAAVHAVAEFHGRAGRTYLLGSDLHLSYGRNYRTGRE